MYEGVSAGVGCAFTVSHVGDYQEHVGLLVADAWNGTYVRQGQWLFGAHVRALKGTQPRLLDGGWRQSVFGAILCRVCSACPLASPLEVLFKA